MSINPYLAARAMAAAIFNTPGGAQNQAYEMLLPIVRKFQECNELDHKWNALVKESRDIEQELKDGNLQPVSTELQPVAWRFRELHKTSVWNYTNSLGVSEVALAKGFQVEALYTKDAAK
jgi:FtsP/CotA-like multicopper oxidase with cupredoxin domain